MRLTAYTYPWDVARLGVTRVLEDLAASSIQAIDLAATYHPIDALSPRGVVPSLFSSPRGAVHFPACRWRYGDIQPLTSGTEVLSAWPQVAEQATAYGLEVNAWVVVLYQPWIVDQYPDCARVLPTGERIGSGVCAANDNVREYVATLCEDVVDQFPVTMVRLEGVAPSGYDYGWLRPRILVEVPPIARELLGLCFCASCVRKATAGGLDVEGIRGRALHAIAAAIANPDVAQANDFESGLHSDPELHAFVIQQEENGIELTGVIADRLPTEQRPKISSTLTTCFPILLGEAKELLTKRFLSIVDQVLVGPSNASELARVAADLLATGESVGLATLLTPMSARFTGTGAAVATPIGSLRGAEQISAYLRGIQIELEEIALYNFGLLRDSDVKSLVAAVTEVFGG